MSGDVVVLIGGAGYIGSHVLRDLLDKGNKVRVFDNFYYGTDGVYGIKHPNLQVVIGDICDTRTVSKVLMGADTCVLLAAVVGHRIQAVELSTIREVNLFASSVVLDAAIEHGVSRFVFSSTDSVYGVTPGVHFETSLPSPQSQYSALKLRMEERVLREKRRDFCPTVLRVCNCHGYSSRMRFDLVVNTFVRDALVKKRIVVQGGEQRRSFIGVKDAARGIVSVVEGHPEVISGEVFNLGNSEQNLQIKSVAAAVQKVISGTEIEVRESSPDLVDYYVNSSKIETALGFKCQESLEDSISKLAENAIKDPFDDKHYNT